MTYREIFNQRGPGRAYGVPAGLVAALMYDLFTGFAEHRRRRRRALRAVALEEKSAWRATRKREKRTREREGRQQAIHDEEVAARLRRGKRREQ